MEKLKFPCNKSEADLFPLCYLQEFLMDLDSHKSIVVSLNIVGAHLADHTEDRANADQLRARLATINSRWDAVCHVAATWQTQLQSALMEVRPSQKLGELLEIGQILKWVSLQQSIK